MIHILTTFLIFVLILVSLFMVLVVLMQRSNTDGGLGSAFGGGITESAFGAEAGNFLSRLTVYSAIAFFVLSLGIYMLLLAQHKKPEQVSDEHMLTVTADAAPAEQSAPAEQPVAPVQDEVPAE
ncbi:MAG: preprotein translocase subunit SecG [Opitutales bacterium]|nr:preprotein translocase subunit SecG [Opitutales bacterium]